MRGEDSMVAAARRDRPLCGPGYSSSSRPSPFGLVLAAAPWAPCRLCSANEAMTGKSPNSSDAQVPADAPPEAMTSRSVAERRQRLEQALASTRISGHEPTPEYLADCQAFVDGELSVEELRERIIQRAKGADQDASSRQ